MMGLAWGHPEEERLAAIRDQLTQVSTATACQLLISQGWRNGYMVGLLPLSQLGLGVRLVGRARTCRYLARRGPETAHDPEARRASPEIVLIEEIQPNDVLCIDALGVMTSGIIGDILSARLKANGAAAAVIHGVVRDSPYINELGLAGLFVREFTQPTAVAISFPSTSTVRSTWPVFMSCRVTSFSRTTKG